MGTSAQNRRSVYLGPEFVQRVRDHVMRLRRAHPAYAVTFSTALRDAALKGLAAVESQERGS